MLVFVVSYLAIYFLLIGMMPLLAPNLLYGGKEYLQTFDVPSYFSSADIENIKYFENETLNYGSITIFDFTDDINFKFRIQWFSLYQGNKLSIDHITWEWLAFYTAHGMDVENGDSYITLEEALENWEEEYDASIFQPVSCNDVTAKIWITDSNETRNDLIEAWDEGVLIMGIGFGFDDVSTSYSAFNLIGLLLTFQSPEIFGATGIIAVTFNLIANSPIYLAIAYLVFYFITSIIPFIKGA